MDTDHLLDLFSVSAESTYGKLKPEPAGAAAAGKADTAMEEAERVGGKRKRAGLMAEIAELCDHSDYAEEFSMDEFMTSLRR